MQSTFSEAFLHRFKSFTEYNIIPSRPFGLFFVEACPGVLTEQGCGLRVSAGAASRLSGVRSWSGVRYHPNVKDVDSIRQDTIRVNSRYSARVISASRRWMRGMTRDRLGWEVNGISAPTPSPLMAPPSRVA